MLRSETVGGFPLIFFEARPGKLVLSGEHMLSTNAFAQLLQELYAAPLDHSRWQSYFDRLCTIANCEMGVFTTSSESGQEALAGGGLNFTPEPLRLYNEHYAPLDPLYEPCMRNLRSAVIPGEELVRRDDYVHTEFFNEVLAPFGLHYVTVVPCLFTKWSGDFITLFRSSGAGPLEDDSSRFIEDLLPHMQSALRMYHLVAEADLQRGINEVTPNADSSAIFILSKEGKVVYSNAKAEIISQRADGLLLRNNRLLARFTEENERLQSLLKLSIERATGVTTVIGIRASYIAMRISRAKSSSLQLVAVPFSPTQSRLSSDKTCVLVIVKDPSEQKKSCGELLVALYELSPLQARIADLLMQGLDAKELPERLSVSYDAVRFHIKQIFIKTGTHKQSELMRLMLSLPI